MYDKQMLSNPSDEFHHALSVYDKAIAEMTHVTYSRVSDSWLTELSAIFGERYLAELGVFDTQHGMLERIKFANRMFKAAHVARGINNEFFNTVERASDASSRVDDETLLEMNADLQGLISAV